MVPGSQSRLRYGAIVIGLLFCPLACGEDGTAVDTTAEAGPDTTESDGVTGDVVDQEVEDIAGGDVDGSQDTDATQDQTLDVQREPDFFDATADDGSSPSDATSDPDTAEPVVPSCPTSDSGAAVVFGPMDDSERTIDILFRNCEPVAGFQMDLIGLELVSAEGGRAGDTFSTLTTNNPPTIDGGRVVAVDLGGASIAHLMRISISLVISKP